LFCGQRNGLEDCWCGWDADWIFYSKDVLDLINKKGHMHMKRSCLVALCLVFNVMSFVPSGFSMDDVSSSLQVLKNKLITLVETLKSVQPETTYGRNDQLFLKMLDGRTLSLDLEQNDTWRSMQEKIGGLSGIKPIFQILIFAGKQIVDMDYFKVYEIWREGSLYLLNLLNQKTRPLPLNKIKEIFPQLLKEEEWKAYEDYPASLERLQNQVKRSFLEQEERGKERWGESGKVDDEKTARRILCYWLEGPISNNSFELAIGDRFLDMQIKIERLSGIKVYNQLLFKYRQVLIEKRPAEDNIKAAVGRLYKDGMHFEDLRAFKRGEGSRILVWDKSKNAL